MMPEIYALNLILHFQTIQLAKTNIKNQNFDISI